MMLGDGKIKDINEIVDGVLSRREQLPSQRQVKCKPKCKKTRKLLLLGVLLAGALITSATLLILYDTYFLQQQGDIELTGVTSGLLFDDTPIATETTQIPMDLTGIIAGETHLFEHVIGNTNSDTWNITFNLSQVNFTNPDDVFYGYVFTTSPTSLFIFPNEERTVAFNHTLNPLFQHTTELLPFNITINVSKHTPNQTDVEAINDNYDVSEGGTYDQYVLDNDYNVFGIDAPLIITDATGAMTTIKQNTTTGVYYIEYVAPAQPHAYEYTVENIFGYESIGIVYNT